MLRAQDGRMISQDIRADFPMLSQTSHGKPYTYINNAATSLKPQCVLDAMNEYYQEYGVSIYRGVDEKGYRADEAFEATRTLFAQYINAPKPECIVFTRGTTAALNLIASSYGEDNVSAGDEVVVSAMEHHANYVPWQQLCLRTGATLVLAPVDENGHISADALASVLTERTKIVALAHMNNVMGAEQDIKALAALAHSVGAIFVVDGAQGIVHSEVDVQDGDVDFYACSSHKLYGPTGLGILYGKYNLLQSMRPLEFGGEMIDVVDVYETSFRDAPWKFESGTMMVAEVIGFGAALKYVQSIGMSAMRESAAHLARLAVKELSAISHIKIYNPRNSESGIVSFNVENTHPHDAASVYDKDGIALRAGHHCAQRTMDWLGCNASLRASFAFYNTEEEVMRFVEASRKAGDFLNVIF